MPHVILLILTWNRRDDVLRCVASLPRLTYERVTPVVIDNASEDDTVAALQARHPGLTILRNARNLGYAGGNNVGLRLMLDEGCDRILVLNNDTLVAPDFLPALLRAMDETEHCGAVCGAVHRADNPDMLNVAFSEVHFRDRNAVQLKGVNALPGEGFNARRMVDAVVGCCLLFKAAALRQVGLFDEAYFAYHEDIDWSLRARRLGWTLVYEPFARVYHVRSGSTALDELPEGAGGFEPGLPNAEPVPFNPTRAYLGARNLMRLVRTHAGPITRRTFALRCLAGLPLEYTAVLFNREGTLQLKLWTYPALLRFLGRERPPILEAWRTAESSGRTAQVRAYARGLWDGWWDRPLPLEQLGLR